jgi:ketosteroid isomerase-like protein
MRFLTLLLLTALVAGAADPAATLADARVRIARLADAARALEDQDRRALAIADLDFAADAAERGAAEAFAARMAPDGRLFPPRLPMSVGPEAARQLFDDDTSLWEWAPVEVEVSGNLGVTWGLAVISGNAPDGSAFAVTTRYTTVWRRGGDGVWRVWLDVGTPGPHDETRGD